MYCISACMRVSSVRTYCHLCNYFLLAALAVWFDPQNYTVTEGDVVNITLVTSSSNYIFDFNVTLQHMNGSATGESCSVTCIYI